MSVHISENYRLNKKIVKITSPISVKRIQATKRSSIGLRLFSFEIADFIRNCCASVANSNRMHARVISFAWKRIASRSLPLFQLSHSEITVKHWFFDVCRGTRYPTRYPRYVGRGGWMDKGTAKKRIEIYSRVAQLLIVKIIKILSILSSLLIIESIKHDNMEIARV